MRCSYYRHYLHFYALESGTAAFRAFLENDIACCVVYACMEEFKPLVGFANIYSGCFRTAEQILLIH